MSHEVEVARLLNKTYDTDTGRLLLTFEVTDPVLRQKLLREEMTARLVLEEANEDD